MSDYLKKGTLQICPYSGNTAIVTSSNEEADKSKCPNASECVIEHCPLEKELNRF